MSAVSQETLLQREIICNVIRDLIRDVTGVVIRDNMHRDAIGVATSNHDLCTELSPRKEEPKLNNCPNLRAASLEKGAAEEKYLVTVEDGLKEDVRCFDIGDVDCKDVDDQAVDVGGIGIRSVDVGGVVVGGNGTRDIDVGGIDIRNVDVKGVDVRQVESRGIGLGGIDIRSVEARSVAVRSDGIRGIDVYGIDIGGGAVRNDGIRDTVVRRSAAVEVIGIKEIDTKVFPDGVQYIVPEGVPVGDFDDAALKAKINEDTCSWVMEEYGCSSIQQVVQEDNCSLVQTMVEEDNCSFVQMVGEEDDCSFIQMMAEENYCSSIYTEDNCSSVQRVMDEKDFSSIHTVKDPYNWLPSMPASAIIRNADILCFEKQRHLNYILDYRVHRCPKFLQGKCQFHKPYTCFHWHFLNQRRRRPSRQENGSYNYSPYIYCAKYDEKSGTCADGDACLFLHHNTGDTECIYHLRYFKTTPCIHADSATRHCSRYGLHCAFCHGKDDFRCPVYDAPAHSYGAAQASYGAADGSERNEQPTSDTLLVWEQTLNQARAACEIWRQEAEDAKKNLEEKEKEKEEEIRRRELATSCCRMLSSEVESLKSSRHLHDAASWVQWGGTWAPVTPVAPSVAPTGGVRPLVGPLAPLTLMGAHHGLGGVAPVGVAPVGVVPVGVAPVGVAPVGATQLEVELVKVALRERRKSAPSGSEVPHLKSMHLENLQLENSHMENPHLENPYLKNPHLENPHLKNAHPENRHLENPHLKNPHPENPHLESLHLDELMRRKEDLLLELSKIDDVVARRRSALKKIWEPEPQAAAASSVVDQMAPSGAEAEETRSGPRLGKTPLAAAYSNFSPCFPRLLFTDT